MPEWLPGALAVLVVASLLWQSFFTFGLVVGDAVGEVIARSSETLKATPMAASAYVGGKLAFYLSSQLYRSALLLPAACAWAGA